LQHAVSKETSTASDPHPGPARQQGQRWVKFVLPGTVTDDHSSVEMTMSLCRFSHWYAHICCIFICVKRC